MQMKYVYLYINMHLFFISIYIYTTVQYVLVIHHNVTTTD